jgi:hypothetical protein
MKSKYFFLSSDAQNPTVSALLLIYGYTFVEMHRRDNSSPAEASNKILDALALDWRNTRSADQPQLVFQSKRAFDLHQDDDLISSFLGTAICSFAETVVPSWVFLKLSGAHTIAIRDFCFRYVLQRQGIDLPSQQSFIVPVKRFLSSPITASACSSASTSSSSRPSSSSSSSLSSNSNFSPNSLSSVYSNFPGPGLQLQPQETAVKILERDNQILREQLEPLRQLLSKQTQEIKRLREHIKRQDMLIKQQLQAQAQLPLPLQNDAQGVNRSISTGPSLFAPPLSPFIQSTVESSSAGLSSSTAIPATSSDYFLNPPDQW